MSIAKSITPILNISQPAFTMETTCTGHDTHPPRQANEQGWLLGLGIAVGTVLLAAVAGQGMTTRPDQEIAWLTQLATGGDAGAQLQLGLAYRDGRYGLAPDAKTGLQWLTQAANNGQTYAADLVGTAYADGQGTQRDMTKAQQWWRIAATHDNAHASLRLGEQLMVANPAEADHWLEQAAAQGNTQAEKDLQKLYRTNNAPASDLRLGKNRLDVAVAQTHSSALGIIADIWNLLNLPETARQTSTSLLQSAEAGDPTAEFQLGMRYRDGAWSVNRDTAKANYWLHRAAADGNHLATLALADAHNR